MGSADSTFNAQFKLNGPWEVLSFLSLLGYLSQLDNYCWGSVPYIELHKTSTQEYFQGSLECEVFIHHIAMKKFANLFEMKINSGMSHLF